MGTENTTNVHPVQDTREQDPHVAKLADIREREPNCKKKEDELIVKERRLSEKSRELTKMEAYAKQLETRNQELVNTIKTLQEQNEQLKSVNLANPKVCTSCTSGVSEMRGHKGRDQINEWVQRFTDRITDKVFAKLEADLGKIEDILIRPDRQPMKNGDRGTTNGNPWCSQTVGTSPKEAGHIDKTVYVDPTYKKANPIDGSIIDFTTDAPSATQVFRDIHAYTQTKPTEEQSTGVNVEHFQGPPLQYARTATCPRYPTGCVSHSNDRTPIHIGTAAPLGILSQTVTGGPQIPAPVHSQPVQQKGNPTSWVAPTQPVVRNQVITTPIQHHSSPYIPQAAPVEQQSFLYQQITCSRGSQTISSSVDSIFYL